MGDLRLGLRGPALPHAKALAADARESVLVAYCEEFAFVAEGGGSLPVHANDGEVKARIERLVAGLSTNGTPATLRDHQSQGGRRSARHR